MQLGALSVEICHILIDTAPILTQLHYSADIIGGGNDARTHHRLARHLYLVAGRVV